MCREKSTLDIKCFNSPVTILMQVLTDGRGLVQTFSDLTKVSWKWFGINLPSHEKIDNFSVKSYKKIINNQGKKAFLFVCVCFLCGINYAWKLVWFTISQRGENQVRLYMCHTCWLIVNLSQTILYIFIMNYFI